MAENHSFDVVSKVDYQEVSNAINQALKEIKQRYDFKDALAEIDLNQKENKLTIASTDDYKVNSIIDILKQKFVKRNVPLKAFDYGETKPAGGNTVKMEVAIQSGISKEKAKDIIKDIKDSKIKVQAQIQDDQLRIIGKDLDDLQEIIKMLKQKDYGINMNFVNYR